MAGRAPKAWLPHVMFQGQEEARKAFRLIIQGERRCTLRGGTVELHIYIYSWVFAPGHQKKKKVETLPVLVLPPSSITFCSPHVFAFDVNCQGDVVIDSRK